MLDKIPNTPKGFMELHVTLEYLKYCFNSSRETTETMLPWVTGLVICDNFEYKVVHAICYLFGGSLKKNVKGVREYCSFLSTVVKIYLKFLAPKRGAL